MSACMLTKRKAIIWSANYPLSYFRLLLPGAAPTPGLGRAMVSTATATDSGGTKVLPLPKPKVGVSGWIQDVGTKVTGLFQNGRVEDDAKDSCVQLAKAHALDAPWVTPLELYEKLEVAGNAIDRASSTRYVLEQQPFIGWRNLGAESLTKTFIYSPTETAAAPPASTKSGGPASVNHTDPPAEWSPLAGTGASVMLYIIRPPPPMVSTAATGSLGAHCSPSGRLTCHAATLWQNAWACHLPGGLLGSWDVFGGLIAGARHRVCGCAHTTCVRLTAVPPVAEIGKAEHPFLLPCSNAKIVGSFGQRHVVVQRKFVPLGSLRDALYQVQVRPL